MLYLRGTQEKQWRADPTRSGPIPAERYLWTRKRNYWSLWSVSVNTGIFCPTRKLTIHSVFTQFACVRARVCVQEKMDVTHL